jgi:ubiquitin fusion degradation protein 1
MFNFFNTNFIKNEWKLKPFKFAKDSTNNYSSKVMLPYSMLKELVRYNHQPPYIFEISHENNIYKTACSVLDFALDRDDIFLPNWMFEQLCLEKGEEVILRGIEGEKGEGICLLPHSVEFLELENPKKELEKTLANYHVLSYGDEILLYFNDIGKCRFTITKTVPEHLSTIYIVDTDLRVDFEEPMGYKAKIESERSMMKYVHIGEAIDGKNKLKLKKFGIFFDWENLNKKD